LPPPRGVATVRVESAAEMLAEVSERLARSTIVIAAAAVADYRPARRLEEKRAQNEGKLALALETTPDHVATVSASAARREDAIVVGFAAETHDVVARARAKLARKSLDLVVANDVSAPGAGFDVDTNQVVLIDARGAHELPLAGKDEIADSIL